MRFRFWSPATKSDLGHHADAIEETGAAYDTLRHAKWVAEKFEFGRRPKLTWGHHAEVAGLDDPAEADALLDEAERRLGALMADMPKADGVKWTTVQISRIHGRLNKLLAEVQRFYFHVFSQQSGARLFVALTLLLPTVEQVPSNVPPGLVFLADEPVIWADIDVSVVSPALRAGSEVIVGLCSLGHGRLNALLIRPITV